MHDINLLTSVPGENAEVTSACVVSANAGTQIIWSCVQGKGIRRTRVIRGGITEELSMITMPDCTSVLQCGNNVWVSTTSGAISIYDPDGPIITVLQCPQHGADGIGQLFCNDPNFVHSVGRAGSCVVSWNTDTCAPVCTYSLPRYRARSVLYAEGCDEFGPVLFITTDSNILVYIGEDKDEPTWEIPDNARDVIWVDGALWTATTKAAGINVWRASSDGFSHIKCLSTGSAVIRLLHVGPDVWAFNNNRSAVLWDVAELSPIQRVVCPQLSVNSRVTAMIASKHSCANVWLVSPEESCHWMATYDEAVPLGMELAIRDKNNADVVHDDVARGEAAKEETVYLQRKLKYIQSVGTIFRQRIGMLLKGQLHGSVLADFETADALYSQALSELGVKDAPRPQSNQQPRASSNVSNEADVRSDVGVHPVEDPMLASMPRSLQEDFSPSSGMVNTPRMPHKSMATPSRHEASSINQAAPTASTTTTAEQIAQFWKDKFLAVSQSVERLTHENERLNVLLHEAAGSGPSNKTNKEADIRRAQHVCEMVKERAMLKQENALLNEEIRRYRNQIQAIDATLFDVTANAPPGALTPTTSALVLHSNNVDGASPLSVIASAAGGSNEQIAQFQDLVSQLEGELSARSETTNRTLQSNKSLQKQIALLQQRLKSAREEAAKLSEDHSSSMSEMQRNIENLLKSLTAQKRETVAMKARAETAEKSLQKLKAEHDLAVEGLEQATNKIESLDHELQQVARIQTAIETEAKREIETLCTSLEQREKRIVSLQDNFLQVSSQLQDKIRESHELSFKNDNLNVELGTLKKQISQLKTHVSERKMFAAVLAEVQGRMELSIEELRRTQRTEDLASAVTKMEQRVASLATLESQLCDKDDTIALKDDEIQRLSTQLSIFERNVNQISSVFLTFPNTVEELERIVVEHDEFKKLAEDNPEAKESVAIRLLEVRAKRSAQGETTQTDTPVTPGEKQVRPADVSSSNDQKNLHSQTMSLLARINDMEAEDTAAAAPSTIITATAATPT